MLSVRCLSCLYVCNVRALWPNGWMDQDETWHAGRPRPWPHCVRRGPSSPSPKGAQPTQFSAHICCSQMAAWIKMPLGMELGLGPGDFVRWGPRFPPPKGGGAPSQIFGPFLLSPNGWMHQDANWYGGLSQPRGLCVRWGHSPPKFSSHVYYSYCDFVIECSSSSSSTLCILFLQKKFNVLSLFQ